MGNQEYEALRYPRRVTNAADTSALDPGRATNVQSVPQPHTAAPSQAATTNGIYAPPGDMWSGAGLKPPSPYKTGSALVDQGLGCDPIGDVHVRGPCLLLPQQRKYLLSGYVARVQAAESQFLSALGDAKVAELMKSDPAETNWMFEIFLDVISLVALNSVKLVIRGLIGGTEGIGVAVSDPQRVIDEISTATETQVTSILGSAAGKARTAGQARQTASAAKGNTEKASAVSFLDVLRSQASTKYTLFREHAPAGASDSELLVLFHAFADRYHQAQKYTVEIKTKLDAFRRTGLSKLGVQQNNPGLNGIVGGDRPEDQSFRIATAAFWVNTPIGRRLALYRRAYDDIPTRVVPLGSGGMLSREATPADVERLKRQDLREHPFVFLKFVSQQFVDAAVEMHVAKWGTAPEEHALGAAEFQAMAWDP